MKNTTSGTPLICPASIETVRKFYERTIPLCDTTERTRLRRLLRDWSLRQSFDRFVAVSYGNVVGSITLCHRVDAPAYSLDVVFVDPRYRRQGVARLLVEQGLRAFAEMGVKSVRVMADVEAVAKIVHGLSAEQRKQVRLFEPWKAREKSLAEIMSENWGDLAFAVRTLDAVNSASR